LGYFSVLREFRMITDIISTDDVEIVTIEDAMEHSRITDNYDELVVQMCLDAAHDIIEQYLNRRLRPTKMIGVVGDYRKQITLPYPPIHSISSITCEDHTENEVGLTEDIEYTFDAIRKAVRFKNSWTQSKDHKEFKVSFDCGYKTVESIPRAIKHAIRVTFASLYENREDTVIGVNIKEIPSPAKRLCRAYRVRPM
jgi:uncharacterized phiE125 gp8 family phage protein